MVVIQGFPMHASHNSVWVTGPSIQNYPKSLNYGVLGYQRYNVPNNIPNPDSLGGRWFSKTKKKSRNLKSKISRSRKRLKKKSRKRRFSTTKAPLVFRELTPGGVSTETNWGFTNYSRFGKRSKKKSRKRNRKFSKKRSKRSKISRKQKFSKKRSKISRKKKFSKKKKKGLTKKSFGTKREKEREKKRKERIQRLQNRELSRVTGTRRSERTRNSPTYFGDFATKEEVDYESGYVDEDNSRTMQNLRDRMEYLTDKTGTVLPVTPYKTPIIKSQDEINRRSMTIKLHQIDELYSLINKIDKKVVEYIRAMKGNDILPISPGGYPCVLTPQQCDKLERKIWKLKKEQKIYRDNITTLEAEVDELMGSTAYSGDDGNDFGDEELVKAMALLA